MTAPDPRLEVIEERLDAARHHGAPAFMIPTADVAYLLAELRALDDALGRVEVLHHGNRWGFCEACSEHVDVPMPCPTRAAVAAATGGGER